MPQEYGQWPLNLCQYGAESTAGTLVPATGIWRGPFGSFEDNNKTEEIEEDVGTMAVTQQQFITWLGATVPFPTTVMNLLQAPIIFSASIDKGTRTGTGTYVRQFNAGTNDVPPVLQTYTLRTGNKKVSADVQVMPFSIAREWELSGKQGEMWKMSGTWMAPRRLPQSFTPSLALGGFDPCIFARTKFFVDNGGGIIGTTQKTGVLLAASIKYRNTVEWVPVGDGNLYGTAYKVGKPQVDFSFTYELEQNAAVSMVATERTRYDDQQFGLFRLQLPGSGVNTMDIDFAGKYRKQSPYNKESDTNTSVTFDGQALYSPVDAKFFEIKHTSSLGVI